MIHAQKGKREFMIITGTSKRKNTALIASSWYATWMPVSAAETDSTIADASTYCGDIFAWPLIRLQRPGHEKRQPR